MEPLKSLFKYESRAHRFRTWSLLVGVGIAVLGPGLSRADEIRKLNCGPGQTDIARQGPGCGSCAREWTCDAATHTCEPYRMPQSLGGDRVPSVAEILSEFQSTQFNCQGPLPSGYRMAGAAAPATNLPAPEVPTRAPAPPPAAFQVVPPSVREPAPQHLVVQASILQTQAERRLPLVSAPASLPAPDSPVSASPRFPAVAPAAERLRGVDELNTVRVLAFRNGRVSGECTGFVIAADGVSTSGHCDLGDRYEIQFINPRTGTVDLRRNTAPMIRDSRYSGAPARLPDGRLDSFVARALDVTGKYRTGAPSASDVGLLMFAGGLPAGFAPVRLPSPSQSVMAGQRVEVQGYSNQHGGTGVHVLRGTVTHVYGTNLELKMDAGDAICHGDSGSPVFVRDAQARTVVGVVSRATIVPQRCSTLAFAAPLSRELDSRGGKSWYDQALARGRSLAGQQTYLQETSRNPWVPDRSSTGRVIPVPATYLPSRPSYSAPAATQVGGFNWLEGGGGG